MGNSSNSDTSKILEAIQEFFISGNESRFAEKLQDCRFKNPTDSPVYIQTTELIEEIEKLGVSYFLILVQHPSISSNESRCLLTWCSKVVLSRFEEMWNDAKDSYGKSITKTFNELSSTKKQTINQVFLNTYSKSIGRLDSFSEACLRFIDDLKSSDDNVITGFFNIDIKPKPFSLLSLKEKNPNTYEIQLNINDKYYEQLCSVINKDAPNDLLKLFFRVFAEEYQNEEFNDVQFFEKLKSENFELIRNGLIGGVSSKIYLEDRSRLEKYYQAANNFLRLNRRAGDLGYNDLERFLSIIQTYAMWAYLTGSKAHFYFTADQNSNVGIYTYSNESISSENRKKVNDLISKYFDLLYRGGIFFLNKPTLAVTKPILLNPFDKTDNNSKTVPIAELSKGINNENEQYSFSVFLGIVSHLRERAKHEGKQLFFNIATGNDEYLRAYYKPLQPRFSKNDNNKNKWSISFDDATDESNLKNEISRLCSLILGNYSFLQEEDVWLCFSFNRKNVIELRYIAKIKERITYSINELNGFDYINKFTAISKNLPEIFLAKIYKNKKVLIGHRGYIRLKNMNEHWILGSFPADKNPAKLKSENPILDAYKRLKSKKLKHPEINQHRTKILFRTMDSIAKEDGLGAMFIILKDKDTENKVENYIADMTDVIEMVKDWRFSELRDEEYLYKLAIQDGATIIDYASDKIEGRKLVSNGVNGEIFDPNKFKLDDEKTVMESWKAGKWSEYGKWYEWGARRMTGTALAYQCRGQLEVFIISSDGEVFYLDGKNVCKLDRNQGKFIG